MEVEELGTGISTIRSSSPSPPIYRTCCHYKLDMGSSWEGVEDSGGKDPHSFRGREKIEGDGSCFRRQKLLC